MNAVPGLTKTERNSRLLSAETRLGLRMACEFQFGVLDCHITLLLLSGKSFVKLVQYVFKIPGVGSFLSQRLCQDPLRISLGASDNVGECTTPMFRNSQKTLKLYG